MRRWVQLSEYEHPPVVETVLAVAFRPVPLLSTVEIVQFWQEHLETEFPRATEQARYEPAIERFDDPFVIKAGEFRVGVGAQPMRYWFESQDGETLIQLQSDWLGFNWRKRNSEYRRFGPGRAQLRQAWDRLQQFVQERGQGPLDPIQCEVTYVNHILPVNGVWSTHSDLHKVCTLADFPETGGLPQAENQSLQARFSMGEDATGRLHVACQPAFSTDEFHRPIFAMTLTARGAPAGRGIVGVEAFFEVGHRWIVGMFEQLTTPELHAAWGKRPWSEGGLNESVG